MENPAIPTLAELGKYDVNRAGQYEAIYQPLYSYRTYATTGHTSLSFFTDASSATNLSTTNMELGGQLPAPKFFLIQSIEVKIEPATLTAATMADVYKLYNSGALRLNIGSKPYVQTAPLNMFPPKTFFDVALGQAVSTTATTTTETIDIAVGRQSGRPYMLKAPYLLEHSQNFKVELLWEEGVQTVSADLTIGVVLDGIEYRESQ